MNELPENNIRKEGLWLYGVIIALAIKEAITRVLSHLLRLPLIDGTTHLLELSRLIIFLILCVRYYFRATSYFYKFYEVSPANNQKPHNHPSFGLDFLCGFCQFLIFSFLALVITCDEIGETLSWNLFPIGLITLSLYDLVWVIINWDTRSYKQVRRWCVFNLLGTTLSVIVFCLTLLIKKDQQFNFIAAEFNASLPLFLVTILDLCGLILGVPLYKIILLKGGEKIAEIAAD